MLNFVCHELHVADVFRFADGRTVFVGPIDNGPGFIGTGVADVVVDGETMATIALEGEMVPDVRHPLGYRSVSTRDPVGFPTGSSNGRHVSLRIH